MTDLYDCRDDTRSIITAGPTPHLNARENDIWFNTTTNVWNKYDGADWVEIPFITAVSLISGDAGNILVLGTDDNLYVPDVDPADLISGDAGNRLIQGVDEGLHVPPVTVDPADLISGDAGNRIVEGTDSKLLSPAVDPADLISADAGNQISQGTDDGLHVPPSSIDPADLISADAGNQIAQGTDDGLHVPALDLADTISADAGNRLVQGTDDGLHVPPSLTDPADLISADAGNQVVQGTDDGLHVPALDPADLVSADAGNQIIQGTDDALHVQPVDPNALISADAGNRIVQGVDSKLHVPDIAQVSTPEIEAATETDPRRLSPADLKEFSDFWCYPKVAGEPNGIVDIDDVVLGWTNGTRTMTIEPAAADFGFWSNGELFTKSAQESIQISDVEGGHYIYYDGSGVLQASTSFDVSYILQFALVAYVYWDAANDRAIPDVISELHGMSMSPATHLYLHNTQGTRYEDGLLPTIDSTGDGDTDSHAQFSVTAGHIWDEDIRHLIASKVLTGAFYKMWRDGASGDWRMSTTADAGLVENTGSGRAAWNEFTGGAWQLTEVTNNDFVLAHIVAIPGLTEGWGVVVGQNDYLTRSQAEQGALDELNTLDLAGWPWTEALFVATVILQTGNGYSNTWKARVEPTDGGGDFIDWRTAGVGAPGSSGTMSDAAIEAAYNNQVDVVSQAEAEAGTSTTVRRWTAERVAQAIAALGGGGSVAAFVQLADPAGSADDGDFWIPTTS